MILIVFGVSLFLLLILAAHLDEILVLVMGVPLLILGCCIWDVQTDVRSMEGQVAEMNLQEGGSGWIVILQVDSWKVVDGQKQATPQLVEFSCGHEVAEQINKFPLGARVRLHYQAAYSPKKIVKVEPIDEG